jgi:hypothetical protein
MTSYTTLTGAKTTEGSIKWLVNYERIDTAGALTDAQAYIYGALRVREMLASASVTISLGAITASLPTGFLDPLLLRAYYGTLTNLPPGMFLDARVTEDDGTYIDGDPTCYSVYNEVFNFDFQPEAAITATCLYYKQPTALGALNTSNWLCTRYPNILRHACQYYAYLQMENDTQAERHKKLADELIGRANVESDLTLRGADVLVTVR